MPDSDFALFLFPASVPAKPACLICLVGLGGLGWVEKEEKKKGRNIRKQPVRRAKKPANLTGK